MPFAVKVQAIMGKAANDPSSPDVRGSEPNDRHSTVKLPGMSHGLEIDPIDDSKLEEWRVKAIAFNEAVDDLLGDFPVQLQMRIMDSDGRV